MSSIPDTVRKQDEVLLEGELCPSNRNRRCWQTPRLISVGRIPVDPTFALSASPYQEKPFEILVLGF